MANSFAMVTEYFIPYDRVWLWKLWIIFHVPSKEITIKPAVNGDKKTQREDQSVILEKLRP